MQCFLVNFMLLGATHASVEQDNSVPTSLRHHEVEEGCWRQQDQPNHLDMGTQ